jgi:hypothetical protein
MIDPREAQDPDVEPPRKGGLVTALGVTNLILGFACACVGAGYGCLALFLPNWFDSASKGLAAAQAAQRSALVAQIAAVEADVAAAPEGSEAHASAVTSRDQLQVQLTRLDQNSPLPAFAAMQDFMGSPAIVGMMFGHASIGLFWNLGLIVTAFGLFGRREWARRLLVGLAATKLLLEIAFGVWVASTMPDAMNRMMEALPAASAGGPNAAQLAQMRSGLQMQGVINGAVGSILGSIYPAIAFIVLLLPGVRREFEDWRHHRISGTRG